MDDFDSASAITAWGLHKSYGRTAVLAGVDLTVPAGSIFALLGPNGAGKTTMVRVLSTLLSPDAGSATVAGLDVEAEAKEVRRRISLTGQYAALDDLQTGRETLVMMGRLLHLARSEARQRADELLEQFELVEAGDRRVKTYSGGMRRRLDLAASLVGRASVLFLDEPTTGLDPHSRQSLWAVVEGLADSGVTILLTTQYLDEADRLADRIAVLNAGQIVAEGSPHELKARIGGRRLDLVLADDRSYRAGRDALAGQLVHDDGALRTLGVGTDGSAVHVHAVLGRLLAQRVDVESVSVTTASLDDVFMALTGRSTHSEVTHV